MITIMGFIFVSILIIVAVSRVLKNLYLLNQNLVSATNQILQNQRRIIELLEEEKSKHLSPPWPPMHLR